MAVGIFLLPGLMVLLEILNALQLETTLESSKVVMATVVYDARLPQIQAYQLKYASMEMVPILGMLVFLSGNKSIYYRLELRERETDQHVVLLETLCICMNHTFVNYNHVNSF